MYLEGNVLTNLLSYKSGYTGKFITHTKLLQHH